MSQHLSGHGGNITVEGRTVEIGSWNIYQYVYPSGLRDWEGRTIIDESASFIEPGDGNGIFKNSEKTYIGKLVVTQIDYGNDSPIITFKGNGELK